MQHILEAIQADASSDEIAALEIPDSYRAAYVTRDEQNMFCLLYTSDAADE